MKAIYGPRITRIVGALGDIQILLHDAIRGADHQNAGAQEYSEKIATAERARSYERLIDQMREADLEHEREGY